MKMTFKMLLLKQRNDTATPAAITATSGSGQSANCGAAFASSLVATVTNAGGVGVAGVAVTFTAPASGASGTFASTGTNIETVTTNASGVATSSTFTAGSPNSGAFNVIATAGALSVNFALTNMGFLETVLITEPASLVGIWPQGDLSGANIADAGTHGYTGTYGSGVALNSTTGADGKPSVQYHVSANDYGNLDVARAVVNGQEGTWVVICKILTDATWADGSYHVLASITADANNSLWLGKNTGSNTLGFVYVAGSTTKSLLPGLARPASGWLMLAFTWSHAAGVATPYFQGINADPRTPTIASIGTWAGAPQATGGVVLGAIYSSGYVFNWKGYEQYGALWNKVLTAAQIRVLFKSLFYTQPQLVCEGDSMTAGTGATALQNSWPNQWLALVGGWDVWTVINHGITSATLPNMEGTTVIDQWYDARRAKNICTVMGGTNDLYLGADAATTISNYATECAARKAAGFKVVAMTILPRTQVGTPGTFEADRQTVNASIRSNYTTYAHALADIGGDATIGAPGASDNTTYYNADKVHPKDAGYAIIAALVKAQTDTL